MNCSTCGTEHKKGQFWGLKFRLHGSGYGSWEEEINACSFDCGRFQGWTKKAWQRVVVDGLPCRNEDRAEVPESFQPKPQTSVTP